LVSLWPYSYIPLRKVVRRHTILSFSQMAMWVGFRSSSEIDKLVDCRLDRMEAMRSLYLNPEFFVLQISSFEILRPRTNFTISLFFQPEGENFAPYLQKMCFRDSTMVDSTLWTQEEKGKATLGSYSSVRRDFALKNLSPTLRKKLHRTLRLMGASPA